MLRSATRKNVTSKIKSQILGGSKYLSYSLPSIPSLENIRVGKTDFSGLYSNKTVDELWFSRCSKLVEKLNLYIEKKNISAPSSLEDLITLTYNKHELQDIYSHASMIHNLQFYFESLKPNVGASNPLKNYDSSELLRTPPVDESLSNEPNEPALKDWIESSFGSIVEFKTLLLNSGKGIKGDGSVWLVAQSSYSESSVKRDLGYKTSNPNEFKFSSLAVMNTYNAGIVDDSIRSKQITKLRQQEAARIALLNKRMEETAIAETPVSDFPNSSTDSDEGAKASLVSLGSLEEAEEAFLFADRKLLPLLCIDVSPRSYLNDYGIFGKQRYLENVWDCIDWDVVSKRAPIRFKQSFEMD